MGRWFDSIWAHHFPLEILMARLLLINAKEVFMKLSWILMFFGLSLSSARADTREEQIQRISNLANLSLESKAECDHFIQNIENIDPASAKMEFYSSKKAALRVLRTAKTYPGSPWANEAALNSFLKINENELPKGLVAGDLRTAISRLQNCRNEEFYGVLNRLVESRQRYHFAQNDTQALRKLIFGYLSTESSGPRYPYQVNTLVNLLNRTVKTSLISPSAEQRLKIANLKQRVDRAAADEASHLEQLEDTQNQVADNTNRNETNVNRPALIQMMWQIKESEKFRVPLADLLTSSNAMKRLSSATKHRHRA
jgi:hypothetical protein